MTFGPGPLGFPGTVPGRRTPAMLRPLALALAGLPLPALAQEGARLAFTLGAGVEAVPSYLGSDEITVGPGLDFDLGYVSLGPLRFGDPDLGPQATGWGVRGSFRLLPGRSAEDDARLAGLEEVDRALELGGGLRYGQPGWEAFAVARYGVTGHESLVADLGVDFIARPTERLTLRAGPRVFLAADGFAETYFGVTEAEAAAGDLPAFDARGGVLSGGVEVAVEYRLSEAWGLEAGARWDHLTGDAGASPISVQDDQLSAFLGLNRRFDIRF